MPKDKEVKAEVYSMFKEGRLIKKEEHQTEVIDVIRIPDDVITTTVSTDRKYTHSGKPLDQYCSASASVFASITVAANEDEMNKAMDFLAAFCEKRLAEKINEMVGG